MSQGSTDADGQAGAPDQTPPVEETPPVEKPESADVAEGGEVETAAAPSADFWGENQRSKAMEKIAELAGKLQEAARHGPAELEAGRNFNHVLGGEFAGWQVVTDVRVMLRRV